jgi:methyl-accepting chemotaxis protein
LNEEAHNVTDPKIIALLADIREPHAYLHSEAARINTLINTGGMDAAVSDFMEQLLPRFNIVASDLVNIGGRYNEISAELEADTHTIATYAFYMIFILMFIVLAVSITLAIILSNKISKPLRTLAEFMQKAGSTGNIKLPPEVVEKIGKLSKSGDEISNAVSSCAAFVGRVTEISDMLSTMAGGDLTNEVKLLSDEDIMGISMRSLYNNLNNMFAEIRNSANQVSDGAKQMADAAQMLAQGSTEQAASIEQLSGSIYEIANKTKDNSSLADKAALLAGTIKSNAEKGNRQMNEMMEAVNEINEAGGSIGKVIKVIDDIAFQTNILALNAAVEAARAGQHGKGFAVVAEEVRNLAAKSAEAAKDTGSLIDNSIEKAGLGARIARDTAESLTEIVSGINESSMLINEIAKSSEEQSQSIGQINIGIDQVAQVVQHNSATAEEEAAASQEMSSQSAVLQDLISRFKLSGGGANLLLPTHGGVSAKRLQAPSTPSPALAYPAGGGDFGKF